MTHRKLRHKQLESQLKSDYRDGLCLACVGPSVATLMPCSGQWPVCGSVLLFINVSCQAAVSEQGTQGQAQPSQVSYTPPVIHKPACSRRGAFRRLCSSVRAQKLLECSQINVNKQNVGKLRIYLHCLVLKGLYPAFYDKGHDERTFVHVECFLGQK